jgi:hypothetical protein
MIYDTTLQQVAQGVQAVSDLRAKVGGGKDAGIVRVPSNSTATDDDMDGFGTSFQRFFNVFCTCSHAMSAASVCTAIARG